MSVKKNVDLDLERGLTGGQNADALTRVKRIRRRHPQIINILYILQIKNTFHSQFFLMNVFFMYDLKMYFPSVLKAYQPVSVQGEFYSKNVIFKQKFYCYVSMIIFICLYIILRV